MPAKRCTRKGSSTAVLFILATLLCARSSSARADYTLKVNPDEVRTASFDGWGCSLAWWSNQFGTSAQADTLADICFSSKSVSWQDVILPGLNLNIVRYNVGGGGGGAQIDTSKEQVSPNMPAFKNMIGFWRNWFNADPASDSWNWNADPQQRSMLGRAKARGVNLFEFFSDSPSWWMCYNHSTAGSDNGGDNLQSWNYDQFARYMATVVKYARDNWNIAVNYVEPFNEPSANWWKYPSTQEGCHFEVSTQKTVLNSLRSELDSRALQSVGLSSSDENDMDTAYNTWTALDADTQNKVTKVNVHGYAGLDPYRGTGRQRLRAAAGNRKLWMSEYGDNDGSGITMADTILRDMNELRPDAWVYWQPYDSGGWGLIQSNPGDNWIGPANRKYYVLAQFSRHIRPGYSILGSDDHNTVIAYSAKLSKLVIVTVNFSNAQTIRYDLSAFSRMSGPIKAWVTTTAPGNGVPDSKHQAFTANLNGKRFSLRCQPNAVYTFEISNVH